MTDSAPTTTPGKRERLIGSAAELVHRHGAQGTTLAQVAEAADVPLGNVYYYFKTRDDLLRAVVDAQQQEIDDLLSRLDARPTPKARLQGLARNWMDSADLVAEAGCPIGGLTVDLAKHDGQLHDCAAVLLRAVVDWATQQFRELGVRDARTRALSLVASVQGASLLAQAFGDPRVLVREVRRIERELGELE
jgi:TetR/AcrR family transcriptional repressor of nem operon